PRTMSRSELRRFVDTFFVPFGASVQAPIELARHLVWGAVDYARRLGFEPAPDFAPASGHLGPLTGPSAIGFGRNGKPYYVQGPHDDAEAIMATLSASAGLDQFHYLAEIPIRDEPPARPSP
ncbi:MAG: DNA-binding response regulator, partial [Acidimicrobiia bacterium]|nr:DNA-binding response regulator [Acidimicrobiia bacterium]